MSQKTQVRLEGVLSGHPSSAVPMPVVSSALAEGLLVLLKWWLDNKMPHTPEEMNAFFQDLVMSGARGALNRF